LFLPVLSNASEQIDANRNVNKLAAESDLIVVGQTLSRQNVGRSQVLGLGADVEMIGIKVSEVLKGTTDKSEIDFTFLLPDHPVGYHGVPPNAHRIVFLRAVGTTFEVANPYKPSLPACPTFTTNEGPTDDRIMQHILASVSCDQLPEKERLETIEVLRRISGQATTNALRSALVKEPAGSLMSLSLISELLRRNDVTVLVRAKEALQKQRTTVSEIAYRQNVALSIRELHSVEAIPELSDLMANPDVVVRRSAAEALRNTESPLAVDSLAKGLRDHDFKVRYLAAIGLAELTAQRSWRPLEPQFRQNESRYIDHWKKWLSSRQAQP